MANRLAATARNCIEHIRNSNVKVSEPGTGRSAILLNPDTAKVRRIHVDGCLVPRGQTAADWIVSKPKVADVIIELKGKNVDHAVEQVEATCLYWHRHREHVAGQVIGAWIICTEYPRASTKVARYREQLRRQGTLLLISTHNGEERPFTDFAP